MEFVTAAGGRTAGPARPERAAEARRVVGRLRHDALKHGWMLLSDGADRIESGDPPRDATPWQGFYLLHELAVHLPPGTAVVLAHDFSAAQPRLEALRAAVRGLEGTSESATTTQILARLLGR